MSTLNPELAILLMLLSSYGFIFVLLRYFSYVGLFAYLAVVPVIANIQVMRAADFMFFTQPIALGSVIFSTTFLVTDILTERFGMKTAQKSVLLSFFGMIIATLFMQITINITPISDTTSHFHQNHGAMTTIFQPSLAILCASFMAYLISQLQDIWVFKAIKNVTGKKLLFLRSIVASALAIFTDNVIFSTFAWYVFSPQPVDLTTLFYSYIIGAYVFRLAISAINVPFLYLSQHIKIKGALNE